ncbi:MAG: hypothetical protein AAF447_16310 [Myxococcota bacterium]
MATVLESLRTHLNDEATDIVAASVDLDALAAAPPAPFVTAKLVEQLRAAMEGAVRGYAFADDGAAVAWLRYRETLYLARVEHRLRGALVGVYMQKVVYGIHGPDTLA